jgi:hypothetical protein
VNSYRRLLEEGVAGNPERLRDEELRDRAWKLVEPLLKQVRHQAAGQLQEAVNTGRGSDKLIEVLPAALQGRVAFLFATVGAQQWGTIDQHSFAVDLHREPSAGDEDLLNLSVIQTLLHGGTVYSVPPQSMPTNGAVAAVFRH